jgi:hypothetical protein
MFYVHYDNVKWFLLQNMKDASLNRNGVFNNGEWIYSTVACLV